MPNSFDFGPTIWLTGPRQIGPLFPDVTKIINFIYLNFKFFLYSKIYGSLSKPLANYSYKNRT